MKKGLLMLCMLLAYTLQAGKANFVDNDWEKARAEAKKQGKYLFVDCYTDWCYWCKVMDKQTFTNDEVAKFMNEHFVGLKMEMEHNFGSTLSMKYRVSGFPSYLIFNPEGKLVYRSSGYMPAENFMKQLKEALDPKTQTSYPGVSDKMELPFPDFYKKIHGASGTKREYPDSIQLLTYLNQQQDLYSEVNYSVIDRLASTLPTKYKQHFLNNKAKYESLYGKEEVKDVILTLATDKLNEAIKDTSEKLENTISFLDAYIDNSDKYKGEYKTAYPIRYYESVGEWKKFAIHVDDYLVNYGSDNSNSINGWSWDVYEKCDDKTTIEKAAGWMKPVIEAKPDYATMDTYAALLYKAGNMKDAEVYANKAIDLGKKAGEKTKSTEDLLEKIKGKN